MSPSSVVDRLHELLEPSGFERRKRTWNRRSGRLVDVVTVQISKAGDALTVNAGVLDPEIYKVCWRADPPTLVDETFCTVRARIGDLAPGGKDVWWPIGEADTPVAVADAVAASVLPFLERMHSRTSMMEFLGAADVVRQRYPPPIIYLAILKNELGDPAGARSLLSELRHAPSGAWRARASDISASIGC